MFSLTGCYCMTKWGIACQDCIARMGLYRNHMYANLYMDGAKFGGGDVFIWISKALISQFAARLNLVWRYYFYPRERRSVIIFIFWPCCWVSCRLFRLMFPRIKDCVTISEPYRGISDSTQQTYRKGLAWKIPEYFGICYEWFSLILCE